MHVIAVVLDVKRFFGGKKSRLQVYNWFCYLGDPPPRNWDDQWYAVMIVLSPIILLICLIPLYSLSLILPDHIFISIFFGSAVNSIEVYKVCSIVQS